MARSMYQYETSPRKIQPEFNPKRKTTKTEIAKREKEKREREQQKQRKMALKQQKRKYHKNIAVIVGVFFILLIVSYRNSLIT